MDASDVRARFCSYTFIPQFRQATVVLANGLGARLMVDVVDLRHGVVQGFPLIIVCDTGIRHDDWPAEVEHDV